MWTREQVAWMAGLIEGEGSFTTHGRRLFGMTVAVGMTDEDVVRKLHSTVGFGHVGVRHREGRQPLWLWRTGSTPQAYAVMMALYPFLGERRRARIEELVHHWLSYAKNLCGAPPFGG
jgi:hypothetical protein